MREICIVYTSGPYVSLFTVGTCLIMFLLCYTSKSVLVNKALNNYPASQTTGHSICRQAAISKLLFLKILVLLPCRFNGFYTFVAPSRMGC